MGYHLHGVGQTAKRAGADVTMQQFCIMSSAPALKALALLNIHSELAFTVPAVEEHSLPSLIRYYALDLAIFTAVRTHEVALIHCQHLTTICLKLQCFQASFSF